MRHLYAKYKTDYKWDCLGREFEPKLKSNAFRKIHLVLFSKYKNYARYS